MTGQTNSDFSQATIARARLALWSLAALLLLAPAVAMQFTDEMRWDAGDFLLFALMLGLAGGAVEAVVRLSRRRRIVVASVLGVGLLFALVWVELAVGIIGGH